MIRIVRRRIPAALAVASAVALAAACSPGNSTGGRAGAEGAGVTPTTVTVGTSTALTGPVASVCAPTSAGATAWFDQVNAAGGVHGRTIRDVVLDDGYQAPRAAANVRTLRSKGVAALFGGCGTVTAATIASMVQGTGLPYLFPYAALPRLVRPAQPNIFSLLPLYSDQARALIPSAMARGGPGPVYAVTTEIPGYQDVEAAALSAAALAHGSLAGSALLPAASAPVQEAAVKAGSAHAPYLMLTVLAPDAARMLNAMAGAGHLPAKGILGVSVLGSQAFAAALTPQAARLLQVASPTVAVGDARAKRCLAALHKYEPHTAPDATALYGCAAAQTFVAALDKAGDHPTPTALQHALESLHGPVSDVTPPLSFTAGTHMGLDRMYLLRLAGGHFTTAGALLVPSVPGT